MSHTNTIFYIRFRHLYQPISRIEEEEERKNGRRQLSGEWHTCSGRLNDCYVLALRRSCIFMNKSLCNARISENIYLCMVLFKNILVNVFK